MTNDENLKIFGQKLKYERSKINLSQELLALKSGLDRSYIGGVERGERNISLINILKLSETIGISPSVLMEGFNEK